MITIGKVSFNTQPPEGGWSMTASTKMLRKVSTHSRLKAAGISERRTSPIDCRFNTQPPEGGWVSTRGLGNTKLNVSTHSRLKAAGDDHYFALTDYAGFNTQPPEGGWQHHRQARATARSFNTQPPEGGWSAAIRRFSFGRWFQHTAA